MSKVLYEKRGEVARITLNRAEAMNAIDLETHQLLQQTWADFRDDTSLRAAIITGAGDESFCAGAYLKTHVPQWLGVPGMHSMGAVQGWRRAWRPHPGLAPHGPWPADWKPH